MKDVKPIIAENLTALRKEKGMTQAELAEQLDYSDKAVSRWEHGDTLPDMNVLCQICEFYGVTLDYLVNKNDDQSKKKFKVQSDLGNRIAVALLAVTIVWLAATLVFVYSSTFLSTNFWQVFVWAIPCSFLFALSGCRNWMPKFEKMLLRSGLTWALITAIYIQFLKYNIWLIFIIGIPAQIIIILWYNIKATR